MRRNEQGRGGEKGADRVWRRGKIQRGMPGGHGDTFPRHADSGCAIWIADASQIAGVYGGCRAHDCAGDRREYGDLQFD